MRCITPVDDILHRKGEHNRSPFWILNKVPPLHPPSSPCILTAEQNMAGGGLSGRARGDLATSSAELVQLVTHGKIPPKCAPTPQTGLVPALDSCPSPLAADATWWPTSLQRGWCRRSPAGSPKPVSMSWTEKAFSTGRQATCRPLLSPFLPGWV